MKTILKNHVKVFCNKVEFQLNSKPMTLFPLPAIPQHFKCRKLEKIFSKCSFSKATVLKYVYRRATHIYFFRPDKSIYNWKFVHRHPLHLDFLFTVLFEWVFAVEKYKLLLLSENSIHQTNIYFCHEFLWVVYFQIKRELKQRNSKYNCLLLCVFLRHIAVL